MPAAMRSSLCMRSCTAVDSRSSSMCRSRSSRICPNEVVSRAISSRPLAFGRGASRSPDASVWVAASRPRMGRVMVPAMSSVITSRAAMPMSAMPHWMRFRATTSALISLSETTMPSDQPVDATGRYASQEAPSAFMERRPSNRT